MRQRHPRPAAGVQRYPDVHAVGLAVANGVRVRWPAEGVHADAECRRPQQHCYADFGLDSAENV